MDNARNTFKNIYNLPWKNFYILCISIIFIHHTYNAPFTDEDCKKIISPHTENEEHTSWWPSHCSLKEYTKESIFKCFEQRRKPNHNFSIVLMGDSHMGSLASSLNLKIRKTGKFQQISNQRFAYNKPLKFEFKIIKIHSLNDSFNQIFKHWEDINYTPDLLVMNCNLHPILDTQGSSEGLQEFRRNLTRQLMRLNKMSMKSNILWYVQPPLNTPRERKNLTNYNVDRYNAMVIQVLKDQRVHLWTSPRLIAVGELQHYNNDVHIPRYQVNKVAKILLNYLCNSYNTDRWNNLCCSKREGLLLTYFNKYSAFITCSAVLLIFISTFKENICLGTVLFSSPFVVSKAKRKESNAFHLLLLFFLKCGACFLLIYFCARTPIIPKEEKHSDFPLISAAIILILSLTCSKEVVESQNLNEIMQSEAKGVLIYFLMFLKFCKCSSMPSEIMKNLLESTLLILTGAEMFREFWKKECSGLLHFLIKIIPLNTLLVILCWLTDNKYGSYDLIPVLMITFPLFYLPLLLPFHKAKDSPKTRLIHHCLKTSAVLFLMLSTIYYWEIDFLSLNIISNFFLNKDGFPDTAIEQWKRNKYSLGVGVLCGILTELYQLLLLQKLGDNIFGGKRRFTTLLFVLGCFTAFVIYFVITDQALMDLQTMFPFLIILLITCYFSLRHLLFNMKQIYSYAFHKIGNCWLQIFVLHFHTILAFDGTAILQMVYFPSFMNDLLLFSMTVFLGLEFQAIFSLEFKKQNF